MTARDSGGSPMTATTPAARKATISEHGTAVPKVTRPAKSARALGVGEAREPHAHDENDAGADDHERRRRLMPGVDDVGGRAEPDVHENDD